MIFGARPARMNKEISQNGFSLYMLQSMCKAMQPANPHIKVKN